MTCVIYLQEGFGPSAHPQSRRYRDLIFIFVPLLDCSHSSDLDSCVGDQKPPERWVDNFMFTTFSIFHLLYGTIKSFIGGAKHFENILPDRHLPSHIQDLSQLVENILHTWVSLFNHRRITLTSLRLFFLKIFSHHQKPPPAATSSSPLPPIARISRRKPPKLMHILKVLDIFLELFLAASYSWIQ